MVTAGVVHFYLVVTRSRRYGKTSGPSANRRLVRRGVVKTSEIYQDEMSADFKPHSAAAKVIAETG